MDIDINEEIVNKKDIVIDIEEGEANIDEKKPLLQNINNDDVNELIEECSICFGPIENKYAIINNKNEPTYKYHVTCISKWAAFSKNGIISRETITKYTIYDNDKIESVVYTNEPYNTVTCTETMFLLFRLLFLIVFGIAICVAIYFVSNIPLMPLGYVFFVVLGSILLCVVVSFICNICEYING